MRTAWGVLAMLALATTGAVLWGGPVTGLWERTFARPCPAGAPGWDCVATVPGRVLSYFDDYGDGDTLLTLEIRGAPGEINGPDPHHAALSLERTNRVLGSTHEDRLNALVNVRFFRGTIEEITGPGGRSAETMTVAWARAEAFLRLLMIIGGAILLVAGTGYLWQRLRGGDSRWIRRAAISTAIGTFAGLTAGRAATALTDIGWMLPVTAVVTVVASLALAAVRLPESWSPRRETRLASPDRSG